MSMVDEAWFKLLQSDLNRPRQVSVSSGQVDQLLWQQAASLARTATDARWFRV